VTVPGLPALRSVDSADLDAYASGFRFHRKGIAIDDRGYLAALIRARRKGTESSATRIARYSFIATRISRIRLR
jgi:hypothetical protein